MLHLSRQIALPAKIISPIVLKPPNVLPSELVGQSSRPELLRGRGLSLRFENRSNGFRSGSPIFPKSRPGGRAPRGFSAGFLPLLPPFSPRFVNMNNRSSHLKRTYGLT